MEALEFLKEHKRMCNSYGHCKGCPLERGFCNFGSNTPDEVCERIIAAVEHWSKGHPRKTRQSVFLEQYPNVRLIDGVVDIAPCQMEPKSYSSGAGGCKYAPCVICRSEFWSQEVE